MDHAAEAMRFIGKKVRKDDFFDLFKMLSLYDDLLVLEGKEDYDPGDTLRLIAPIVSTMATEDEIRAISEAATLTPGAKDFIASLNPKEVYVASTSYQQHAYTVAAKLGIDESHVNCTQLPDYEDFPYMSELEAIFVEYKKSGAEVVKPRLDELFWDEMDKDYLKTKVCGGSRKEAVAERLSKEKGVPLSEFMVVGDSITDINMLRRVAKEGGLAVSFNGNQYSAPEANIAVSSLSLMALRPLVDAFPKQWDFIDGWNVGRNSGGALLKLETNEYFLKHKLKPFYDDLRSVKDFTEIVKHQKEMRSAIRKEYGDLT
jgi:energy-converting hydrogenase A subunit R